MRRISVVVALRLTEARVKQWLWRGNPISWRTFASHPGAYAAHVQL